MVNYRRRRAQGGRSTHSNSDARSKASHERLRRNNPEMFRPIDPSDDYLDEDPKLPGQNWGCFSFVTSSNDKNTIKGFKQRGVFDTREEADAWANKLRDINDNYHIFVGQIGYWLAFDPDPDSCQDQLYKDNRLNKLMKEKAENRMKRDQEYEQRKEELKQKAIYEGSLEGQAEKSEQMESVEAVQYRLDALEARLTECQEQLKNLPERIEETQQRIEQEKERLEEAKKVREKDLEIERRIREEVENR